MESFGRNRRRYSDIKMVIAKFSSLNQFHDTVIANFRNDSGFRLLTSVLAFKD